MSMSEGRSVRGMVADIKAEMLTANMTPTRMTELLRMLTALYGSVMDKTVVADVAYHERVARFMAVEADGKAARAEVMAKTTPEYKTKLEMEALEKHVAKMISSLTKSIDVVTQEMRFSARG
jgi:hypothetical protein